MPRRTIASSISGSTLPPETTATTGDGQRPGYSATAATAAAPAGSTSSLPRSRLASTARDSASSLTVTISATWVLTCANVSSPGRGTAMPSAIVAPTTDTGSPAASEGGHAAY